MTDLPPNSASANDVPATGGRAPAAHYRVLARKYRPARFSDLIGQEAMVRTLSNAMATGRLAHAFILTGVRGVGKTTTARIIARALNCIGPDGKGGPTPEPCGECEHCRSIAEDRHVDVLEMDAASHTGVDDIRDIIDGVRYLPAAARNKIYIIDEVHMLSRNAFNALLKTLEEPPEHVRFVFATTEIRKVPVTVLSRCQRFDLRRVDADILARHFSAIAGMEKVEIEPEAVALIARAAEGSVRDGLSLLDQAIAHGAGKVDADQVRDMLGLADRARVFELFDAVMRGDMVAALDGLKAQYDLGAEPSVVLQDMLELTHWITRVKLVPEAGDDVTVSEMERRRGREMAVKLSMPVLGRTWQMLLKGVQEVITAPFPLSAAEMVLVRLAYAADLPPPAEVLRRLDDATAPERSPAATPAGGGDGPRATAPRLLAAVSGGGRPQRARAEPQVDLQVDSQIEPPVESPVEPMAESQPALKMVLETGMAPQPAEIPAASAQAAPDEAPIKSAGLVDFRAVVDYVAGHGEPVLAASLKLDVHLVRFSRGRIELRLGEGADRRLPSRLGELLTQETGERWTVVIVSGEPGEPTLKESDDVERAARMTAVEAHPLVRAVREAFPGAKIARVEDRAATEMSAAEEQFVETDDFPDREEDA